MMDEVRLRNRVLRLRCAVKDYEWGRKGEQSAAGRVYALQSNALLAPDKPYAELWMGAHDSGPSLVVLGEQDDAAGMCKADCEGNFFFNRHDAFKHSEGDASICESNAVNEDCHSNGEGKREELPHRSILLKDWLSDNPSALGDRVFERWGADLPFLFKVLSVQKALSIQAHPDKQLAERLHQLQPSIYKDANHKPEMVFAITNFEALCGFVSYQEIQGITQMFPELQQVLGKTLSHALANLQRPTEDDAKDILKAAFIAIMSASKAIVKHTLDQLTSRLQKAQAERSLIQKELLVLRLTDQYSGDVGILSSLFLNYIQLEPGQALYFNANEPHAYLFGECLECMAASDNVVRAGLTPKYIDIKTLCNMLTYKQGMPEILPGFEVNAYTKRYAPPFDEFEMDSCLLPVGQTSEFPSIDGPSILLVLEGSGTLSVLDEKSESRVRLKGGDTMFVPAETSYDVTTSLTSDISLRFYRVGVNSRFLSER